MGGPAGRTSAPLVERQLLVPQSSSWACGGHGGNFLDGLLPQGAVDLCNSSDSRDGQPQVLQEWGRRTLRTQSDAPGWPCHSPTNGHSRLNLELPECSLVGLPSLICFPISGASHLAKGGMNTLARWPPIHAVTVEGAAQLLQSGIVDKGRPAQRAGLRRSPPFLVRELLRLLFDCLELFPRHQR